MIIKKCFKIVFDRKREEIGIAFVQMERVLYPPFSVLEDNVDDDGIANKQQRN